LVQFTSHYHSKNKTKKNPKQPKICCCYHIVLLDLNWLCLSLNFCGIRLVVVVVGEFVVCSCYEAENLSPVRPKWRVKRVGPAGSVRFATSNLIPIHLSCLGTGTVQNTAVF
jgi:hypothetical protein